MFKILILSFLLYGLIFKRNVECHSVGGSVDIECSSSSMGSRGTYEHLGTISSCKVCAKISFIVNSPKTKVRKVVGTNGSKVETSDIEILDISNAKEMKFIPTGVKKMFPKLKAIRIVYSGLIYLSQQELKQFGEDLVYARFHDNQLTALEGDLFNYNPKLILVDFQGNSLKFIDSRLFESFTQMNYLEEVDFLGCDCLNQTFKKEEVNDIQTFNWKAENCTDETSRNKNFEILEMYESNSSNGNANSFSSIFIVVMILVLKTT